MFRSYLKYSSNTGKNAKILIFLTKMSYFSARNFFSFKKQASFLKYFLVYMISPEKKCCGSSKCCYAVRRGRHNPRGTSHSSALRCRAVERILPDATSGPSDVGEVRSFTWQCHMVNTQMAQPSAFIYCPLKNLWYILYHCNLVSWF